MKKVKIIFLLFFIIFILNSNNKSLYSEVIENNEIINSSKNNITKYNKNNQEIKNKIVFSNSPRLYPFEFYDKKKNPAGFDIDFARLIGKYLNLDVIIQDNPILFSFKLLEMNKFDAIISTIVLTDQRKKTKDFLISKPYFEDDMILIFLKKKENNVYKKLLLNDFHDKKISCTYGCFIFKEWFSKNLPNAQHFFFNNPAPEFDALLKNQIDAILINKQEGLYLKNKYPDKIDFITNLDLKVEYIILVNKNQNNLLLEINNAIIKIHENKKELNIIKEKYNIK
jgi:ABC-type amino acid transport substrate-binding protein